jgi:hypothetical protein
MFTIILRLIIFWTLHFTTVLILLNYTLKSKSTIRYLSIFVTTKMINEVGTVAKSNRKIVTIENFRLCELFKLHALLRPDLYHVLTIYWIWFRFYNIMHGCTLTVMKLYKPTQLGLNVPSASEVYLGLSLT